MESVSSSFAPKNLPQSIRWKELGAEKPTSGIKPKATPSTKPLSSLKPAAKPVINPLQKVFEDVIHYSIKELAELAAVTLSDFVVNGLRKWLTPAPSLTADGA